MDWILTEELKELKWLSITLLVAEATIRGPFSIKKRETKKLIRQPRDK
jgi:hypothetical protein